MINFAQGLGQLKHLAMEWLIDIGSPGLCIQTKATSLNWFVIIPISQPMAWFSDSHLSDIQAKPVFLNT